jgi:ABC-2 type transport system ATP-binding protein
MIEAEDLCKTYGKQRVLNRVSFTLDKGHVMGILGPNGAGKTTLIKILALITRPDSGTLRVNGQDAFRAGRLVRPLIGYVPQDIALFEDLSVRDNLMCWSGRKGRCAKEQAARLIEELSMTSFAVKRISALSGGMKRRVNLAVAMLDDPQVLILDEPLVGVDIEQRQQILESLTKLAQAGVTQIIASHHAEELLPLAGEMMVIRDGDILFSGKSQKLLDMRDAGNGTTLDGVVLKLLNRRQNVLSENSERLNNERGEVMS